jgi:hypothetical protein
MVLPPSPQPRFWKALIFAAIPVGFVLWTILARSSVPAWIALALWAGASLAVAGIVHTRMLNDWRASDTMHLHRFERGANVGRNVRIKRR